MLQVTQFTPESISYLVLGGFVVFFSLVSLALKERVYFGEVVLGTAFGIIVGPHCAGILDPRSWSSSWTTGNRITLEIMRVVLAIGLFSVGVELPKGYLAKHARSLIVMVVPTMAFGWFVVAGVIKGLFPALNFVSSLVIAACLTPTDPVLAVAIIGGRFARKHIPVHLSHLLSAESASNDGLAYPFLSISIYLATESSTRVAFGKFFLVGCLYQVILGTVLGVVLGIIFSRLMRYAYRKGLADKESLVVQYLALAMLTIGIANSIGSDDLLAAFAAGSAIAWDGDFNAQTGDQVFSSVIDLVLNCICFVYIGAWIPFESFNDTVLGIRPWRLIVLLTAILTLRRIPSILLLYKFVPDIRNWREALFCGHFGPMGVGAVFISALAISELPVPSNPPATQNELLATALHPIISFVVLGSIIIHGLSISVFYLGKNTIPRTLCLATRTWASHEGRDPGRLFSGDGAPVRDDCASFSQTATDIERLGTPGTGLELRTPDAVHSIGLQTLSRATGANMLVKKEDAPVGIHAEEIPEDKRRDSKLDSVRVPTGAATPVGHDVK
ncbi:hypothetical protein ACEPAF_7550 [Sanghuangporus sanghuang]